jgi:hypothetical protein
MHCRQQYILSIVVVALVMVVLATNFDAGVGLDVETII